VDALPGQRSDLGKRRCCRHSQQRAHLARCTHGYSVVIQRAPGDAQTIPMAVNLDQLRFDVPGAYSFVIEIDGTEVERLIFRVTLPVGLALAAS
jgi:Family of unknown function (DUF6941)